MDQQSPKCRLSDDEEFEEKTDSSSYDQCLKTCLDDKACKTAYHNRSDESPECFVTDKNTYELDDVVSSYELIFHRNSAQFCHQQRIDCVLEGEQDSNSCIHNMNVCLKLGPQIG